jgi:hypothetical protein
MDCGVFNLAFMAAQSYMQMATFCGSRLVELEEQMRTYCTRMLDFYNRSQVFVSLPYWQLSLNLMGQNDVPTILTGEAMIKTLSSKKPRLPGLSLHPK